ncbi:MAG: alpha/beta hydrolase [Phycisphaerales bacterium JB060]
METKSTDNQRTTCRKLARSAIRLGGLVAGMGVLLLAIGLIFSPDRAMIFPASIAGPLSPPPAGVEAFKTDAGLVWFLPAEVDSPAPLVLLFHGNGDNIAGMLMIGKRYQAHGMAVGLIEYPGYGGTPGKPTQASVTRAAVAGYDALVARPEIDGTRVLAHGFSLGGGVAAQLAERRKLSGLILESTFSSMTAMYRSMRVPGILCRDPFRTDTVLAEFKGPVLLIHGRNDTIVPPSHSKTLLDIALDARYLEMDGGHNDGPSDPADYWRAIDELLRRAIER